MTTELRRQVYSWGLTKRKREYIVVMNSYAEARKLYKVKHFDVRTGYGEQRREVKSYVKELAKEFRTGTFTPTPIHVGVRDCHVKKLRYEEENGQRFAILTLDDRDHLPLLNGGQRFAALEKIRAEAGKQRDEAPEKEKAKANDYLALVDSQPIIAVVLLNGNCKTDFINLQRGKPLDASHLQSLQFGDKVASKKGSDRFVQQAYDIAKQLQSSNKLPFFNKSPFFKQIRFDTLSKAPLPVARLCSKVRSDMATSLVGLAKVGHSFKKPKSVEWLANVVNAACSILREKASKLLEDNRVLTPPPDGTVGSATILIGVGVALAFRMMISGSDRASERDSEALVTAALKTLDRNDKDTFTGQAKRKLMSEFVKAFFADLPDLVRQDGLPVDLLQLLAPLVLWLQAAHEIRKKKWNDSEQGVTT